MIKRYVYYFIKKMSDRSHRSYYARYYSKEMEAYRLCPEKKPPRQIRKEMNALRRYWKTYPFQYFRYRLYRKDCPLTLEEMKDYLPDYFAYYLFYPRSFKERNILCEDKRLFSVICQGYGINQPTLLYSICKGVISDGCGQTVSAAEMVQALKKQDCAKLFFKPTYGVGGREIVIFVRKGNTYRRVTDDSELSESTIHELLSQEYIVQAGVTQHEVMNEMYPNSVNTFRIVTRSRDNRVEIMFSILRLGQYGNHVDNASSGGMYIKVDKNNGMLDEYATAFSGEKYASHPDTAFRFSGYQIPKWEEIAKFAEHLAQCFSEIEYVGWDIAYTKDGPAVIEANNGPGVSLLQDCYGGIRQKFGITNPRAYWFSENYALKDL